MARENELHPGQLIAFTRGEYSDFRLDCICVVRQRIDLEVQLDAFVEAVLATGEYDYPICDQATFIFWLCAKELLVVAPCREIHLGSYGEIGLPSGKTVNGWEINDQAGELHPTDAADADAGRDG